ncbi:MAG: aminotransferase class V-fold PLP-dependent enzyme [Sphingopyxis sp.]
MTLLPAEVAQCFHVPGPGPYLAAHAAGCLPKPARSKLETAMLSPWAAGANDAWDAWLGAIGDFRSRVAALLGVEAAMICPQPNVTAGFGRWLGALPPPKGERRDVVMSASSFPSLGFVAGGMERLGYRLRLLANDADVRDAAMWRSAIDERTAVVLVMHVTSNSGAVAPVAEIVHVARAAGARVCIDIAQSVGALPTPAREWNAHAVVGSCLKWLCGGPGAGFIALDPADIRTLSPLDPGWWSHEAPFEMDIRDFRPAPDALRLWGGTPDVAPFVLASAGIETISSIGVDAIRAHGLTLQALAHDTLAPLRPKWRWPDGEVGGTLCIDVGDEAPALAAAFAAHAIRADFRGRVMRLSFAAWNGEGCVKRVAAALSGSAGAHAEQQQSADNFQPEQQP